MQPPSGPPPNVFMPYQQQQGAVHPSQQPPGGSGFGAPPYYGQNGAAVPAADPHAPGTVLYSGFVPPGMPVRWDERAPAIHHNPRQAGGPAAYSVDPFMAGLASSMIKPNLDSALHRGQAFVQTNLGFLSSSALHYHFNISSEYVRKKLLMLLAPYLKSWHHVRQPEQISGGHKYQPPRQDVNAPDLYIPLMAMWTYCCLVGASAVARNSFRPDVMYSVVSRSLGAWLVNFLVLKAPLYWMGWASVVPTLEAVAYMGYGFVPTSIAVAARLVVGGWAYWAAYLYCTFCLVVVLTKTINSTVMQERQSHIGTPGKYWLLALALFQFVFVFFLSRS